jgi:hypothetical protein
MAGFDPNLPLAACSKRGGIDRIAATKHDPATREPTCLIDTAHRLPNQFSRGPVGRILEPGDVEDKRKITAPVVPADRRIMATTCLSHDSAVVGRYHNSFTAGRCRKSFPPFTQTGNIRSINMNFSSVAARQTCELIKVYASGLHLVEGGTAVEQVF